MKKVYICSRYRADERHSIEDNINRALGACTNALLKGYAPIAPHLIYPRCLFDDAPKEREIGLAAARAWIAACDELWVWGATLSEEMAAEIEEARKLGIPVKVFNSIGIPKECWRPQPRREEIRECGTTGKSPSPQEPGAERLKANQ